MTPKYLVIDTETGGLDPRTAPLLTLAALCLDDSFGTVGTLELALSFDETRYQASAKALEINKINPLEHAKVAIAPSVGQKQFKDFLAEMTDGGSIRLIPAGHNVDFDLRFIDEHLIPRAKLETTLNRRVIDTAGIARFLQICGLIPPQISGSLESLCKFFSITNHAPHTAIGDATATADLLFALKHAVIE